MTTTTTKAPEIEVGETGPDWEPEAAKANLAAKLAPAPEAARMEMQEAGSMDYPQADWDKARDMVDGMARAARQAGNGYTVTTGNGVYATMQGGSVGWFKGNCTRHGDGQQVMVSRGRAMELVCRDIMGATDDRLYDWRNG